MIKTMPPYILLEKLDPTDEVAPYYAKVKALHAGYSGDLQIDDVVIYEEATEIDPNADNGIGENLMYCKEEQIILKA
jgi:hypothetical protein